MDSPSAVTWLSPLLAHVSRVGTAVSAAIGGLFEGPRGSQSPAFMMAFVPLAAKMAKADGVAVLAEEQAFLRFLGASPDLELQVRKLWALAKQDVAGFEVYAERIATLLANEPAVLRNVLECLFLVACSDGVLHDAEARFLAIVAEKFRIDERTLRQVRALFLRGADDPYEVLGLPHQASMAEVKTRYRQLVREFHPDSLIAGGAAPPLVKAATSKLVAINAAFEAIEAQQEPPTQTRTHTDRTP